MLTHQKGWQTGTFALECALGGLATVALSALTDFLAAQDHVVDSPLVAGLRDTVVRMSSSRGLELIQSPATAAEALAVGMALARCVPKMYRLDAGEEAAQAGSEVGAGIISEWVEATLSCPFDGTKGEKMGMYADVLIVQGDLTPSAVSDALLNYMYGTTTNQMCALSYTSLSF